MQELNRRTWIATGLTVFLGACATPKASERDASFKTVAVLSLIDEKARIARIGLTAFNNESKFLNLEGRCNDTIQASVADRLHRLRPGWKVVPAATVPELSVAKMADTYQGYFRSSVGPDIAAVARASGADAVFVVGPNFYSATPVMGAGLVLRTLSLTEVQSAAMYATIRVSLFDAGGNELGSALAGDDFVGGMSASSLGLTYDLSTLDSPATHERVVAALLKQMETAVGSSLRFLGYR